MHNNQPLKSPIELAQAFGETSITAIIRHGPKDRTYHYTKDDDFDVPLSDTGIEKTQTFGKLLANNLDVIVHSPLWRTTQTAQYIRSCSNCPIIKESVVFQGFERINLNKWISYKQEYGYMIAIEEWLSGDLPPDLIEPFPSFIDRVWCEINRLRTAFRGQKILIITQEFVILGLTQILYPDLQLRKFNPLHGIVLSDT